MTFAKTTARLFPTRPDRTPPSIASSNLVFHVYIELFLNSCEIIRHRNPTQKNTKARENRRIVEFSPGELWSFHPENCRVFTRRIVEFSPGELLEADDTLPLHTPTTPYYQGSFKNHETHETHETPSFRYYLESSGTIPRDDDIQSIRAHSCPFVVLNSFRVFRAHSWFCFFFSCISCGSWFNPFVPFRANSWFNPFVSIRVHSWFNPFVPIRVHSWFWVLFVYFVCFVVQAIRGHSRPFVSVRIRSCPLVSIRIHSYPFVSIRIHSYPFVSIRVRSCPFVYIRGSKSLSCISCVSWFNPFVSIRGFSSSFRKKQAASDVFLK